MSNYISGYFGSPVDGKFELAWFLRQFLRLFSVRISQRWYEAKGHRRVNTLLALCCAFGLCEVVQYSFGDMENDDRFFTSTKVYWFRFMFSDKIHIVGKLIKQDNIDKIKNQIKKKNGYNPAWLDSIFICGYNVAYDSFNGVL